MRGATCPFSEDTDVFEIFLFCATVKWSPMETTVGRRQCSHLCRNKKGILLLRGSWLYFGEVLKRWVKMLLLLCRNDGSNRNIIVWVPNCSTLSSVSFLLGQLVLHSLRLLFNNGIGEVFISKKRERNWQAGGTVALVPHMIENIGTFFVPLKLLPKVRRKEHLPAVFIQWLPNVHKNVLQSLFLTLKVQRPHQRMIPKNRNSVKVCRQVWTTIRRLET